MLHGNRTSGKRHVSIGGGTAEIEIVNYRLSPRSRLREHLIWITLMALLYRAVPIRGLRRRIANSTPWIGALVEADWIGDIRGGDSFSDIYGLQRFILDAMPCILALIVGKRITLLPQTYGPFNSMPARLAARRMLLASESIYSRDRKGLACVRDLLGARADRKAIHFCPDVAFTLEARAPSNPRIAPPLRPKGSVPLIGLNVSGLLYIGGYTRSNMFGLKSDYKAFVHELLRALLDKTDADILMVPHDFGSETDREEGVCRAVGESASIHDIHRVHFVEDAYDQSGIKGIIGQCDFFIGARMHACIGAISQRIPTVGIAYSHKFFGVFESAGVGDMVLDAREMEAGALIDQCLQRFRDRGNIAGQLEESIPRIQAMIQERFREELAGGSSGEMEFMRSKAAVAAMGNQRQV